MNRALPVNENQMDLVFQALANVTRRALLARLRGGPARVTELAKPFNMSLNAISKHLIVLEHAGLITRSSAGRVQYCRLGAKPMAQASNWLLTYQEFWDENLNKLTRFVESGADLKEK